MKKFIFTILFCLIATSGFCADRYWVGGGSSTNWNATGDTNWSETSGGSGNASVPTSSDEAIFDANSVGNSAVPLNAVCASLNTTGYTGKITIWSGYTFSVYGDFTVSSSTFEFGNLTNSGISFRGTGNITTGGAILGAVYMNTSGTVTLQDTFTSSTGSGNGQFKKESAGTFDTNSQDVIIEGNGRWIQGNFTFYNLTRNGYSSASSYLYFSNDITVTNTLTLAGNSATNRLFVYSNSLGTARTITNTGATMTWSNVDFRDIALSDSYDASAITGGSGDCGGNTNITFTTADDWYFYESGGGTYDLSDYTQWYTATNGGGSQMASTLAPLPQDTLYFDADSINGTVTVSQDMVRIPSVDFTGVDAVTFDCRDITNNFYGSLVLDNNVTFQDDESNIFYGRGSYTLSLFGKTMGWYDTNYVNMLGGTLTLASNLTMHNQLQIQRGTFYSSVYDVTIAGWVTIDGTQTRSLDMGSGTWTLSRAGNSLWIVDSQSNLTFDAGTSTIIAGTDEDDCIFNTYDMSFNNLTNAAGTGSLTLQGSGTFNTLTAVANSTIKFTDGTTQTVSSFVATGTSGNEITLTGTSTAGWTISDSTGTNAVEYCDISYSTAEGGATWNALTTAGNTDSGNNSGWIFGSSAYQRGLMIF